VKMLVLRGHHFHDFLDRVPDFRRRLKMIQEARESKGVGCARVRG
tara:strand:+ start:610 stop:744 length:135 start_codon:yes stop_codon:yes gene_type:complete